LQKGASTGDDLQKTCDRSAHHEFAARADSFRKTRTIANTSISEMAQLTGRAALLRIPHRPVALRPFCGLSNSSKRGIDPVCGHNQPVMANQRAAWARKKKF